jgi:hypothetical protein
MFPPPQMHQLTSVRRKESTMIRRLSLVAFVAGIGLWPATPCQAHTGEPALNRAARDGDVERVRALLHRGVAVDARDASGRTALVSAALAGQKEVVKTLLAAHSDVDATDRDGLTALIAATREDDVAMARVLLDAGASPDLRHRAWGTALDIAETSDREDLVRILRAHGARGSGKSVGDTVCVTPWSGEGYCAVVEGRTGPRFTLKVISLVGCAEGCAAKPDCSDNRPVGGREDGALAVGELIDVPGACLTRTGVGGAR